MAVLFAKDPSRMETVNDLHEDLTNCARVLTKLQTAVRLYERLARTLFCEGLHSEARERLADEVNAEERAYWFLVHSWMGRNGTAGTATSNSNFCVRYTSKGGDPAVRFRTVAESIPAWHERLRGVTILCRDGLQLCERFDDAAEVAVYVDPPYLKKGSQYLHDFKAEDHRRLADLLHRFTKARVVVSYYDDPRLAEMYPGWTKRTFNVSKAMAHQGRRGKSDARAVEVLLLNGPSYVEPDAPLFDT
jgi:DNA adenine methylase